MGRVDLAVGEASDPLYAVKRLHPALRDVPAFRTMFLDEARIAQLLSHPHLVCVREVGEDADGPFLAMEFVDGITAATLLGRAVNDGILLPVQLCVRVCMDVANGLHAAHEALSDGGEPLSLVHRDVSPANILLGYDGVVRVTDFGIAKARGRATRTSTGALKGKTGYMSPEQLRFDEVDRRSDLFSMGIVLFELLASTRLYWDRDDVVVTHRILHEPPPDIDDVRQDVHPAAVELLFELLAKDPRQRPPNAQLVAARLQGVAAELESLEGPIHIAPFLEVHFGEVRARERVERETRMRQLR
jgi:serine/threonine-protein kinase